MRYCTFSSVSWIWNNSSCPDIQYIAIYCIKIYFKLSKVSLTFKYLKILVLHHPTAWYCNIHALKD
jgi:hypothetical protein